MTRWITTLIAVALMVGLTGCGVTNGKDDPETTPSVSTPSQTRPVLDSLRLPNAEMIQNDTMPPYGYPNPTAATGEVGPRSPELARSKGLAENGLLNADYATVQNMYKAILFPWLIDQLDLATYDAQIAEAGIPAVPETKMSLAQYGQHCRGLDLKYLYIRNNIYIERLTQEQIDLFLAHANDPEFATNPELNEIVFDTYPMIIRLNNNDNNNLTTGYDVSGHLIYNDAVVVELDYAITDDDLDETGRFNDLYHQHERYLYDIAIPTLERELPQHWPGDITLLRDYIIIESP